MIQGMGREQEHRSNGDRPVGKGVIAWTWLQGWEQEQGIMKLVPVQGVTG